MTELQQLRTVLKYPGAKWRIANWIIDKMPVHKSYLEPYFGSGAVFFKKPSSLMETINDIDGEVVNLFMCIRDNADKLAQLVANTPFSRQDYDTAFITNSNDPYESARIFLIKHWQGYGFRTGAYKAGWKNDVQGRDAAYAMRYWYMLPKWIIDIVDRLKEAQIECRPAVEVIKRFNFPNVLIYADPPYLLNTRKMKKQYQYEMTETDHVELLETLLQHEGPVILSGYDNELYNEYLSGWIKYSIKTTAEKGAHRIETLWVKVRGK